MPSVPPRPPVRAATADDLPAVATTFAAAFADDPLWRWLCPSPRSWSARATRYFRVDVRSRQDSGGTVLLAADGGAAALWAPPGRWRTAAVDLARDLVPALSLFRHRTVRAGRLLATLEGRHPSEDHWYLALLGTSPDLQGHGHGSALVTAITDRCDDEGLGAYLESSKPENVPFYERLGFTTTGVVTQGGSPPVTLMWRTPRAAR